MLRPTAASPVRRAIVAGIAGAAMVLVAAGCGTSGRDLRTPAPEAVSPTRSSTPVAITTTTQPPGAAGSAGTAGAAPAFSLTSTSFVADSALPASSTCDGPSPELQWSGVPADTAQLVLAVIDRDAQDAVHWLVTGIAPTNGLVFAGTTPVGARTLPNSFGRNGWTGPCPDPGATHRIDVVMFALPSPITVAGTTPAADALAQVRAAAAGRETTLPATVTR